MESSNHDTPTNQATSVISTAFLDGFFTQLSFVGMFSSDLIVKEYCENNSTPLGCYCTPSFSFKNFPVQLSFTFTKSSGVP